MGFQKYYKKLSAKESAAVRRQKGEAFLRKLPLGGLFDDGFRIRHADGVVVPLALFAHDGDHEILVQRGNGNVEDRATVSVRPSG